MTIKKKPPPEKSELHPRNPHRHPYDFELLTQSSPELIPFVKLNKHNTQSIDFANPQAVKILNTALLKHFYHLIYWDIPHHYLCPPIPGRADYLHYIADLLATCNDDKIPFGNHITCLDIGVGANCVYPIIGVSEYQWQFIGSDIDPVAITSAKKIVTSNPSLNGKIELRLQSNPNNIFNEIIQSEDKIDITICNPPFHSSLVEARKGSLRKIKNLTGSKPTQPTLNFGGQNTELFCQGGEKEFIKKMIEQSKSFSTQCFWFSTLVSRQDNLPEIYAALHNQNPAEIKTISMSQGNKISRIVASTFLNSQQQKEWINAVVK